MNKRIVIAALLVGAAISVAILHTALVGAQESEPILPSIRPYTAQVDDNPKNIADKWEVPEDAIHSYDGSPLAPGSNLHPGLDPGKRLSVVIKICECHPDGKGGEWCWEQNANEWSFVWDGREVDSCP